MFGALVVVFLQVAAPDAAAPVAQEVAATAPAAEAPVATPPPGMMDCEYNRATRERICTTSTGERLRCRRERSLGSRFPTQVCFTFREDEQIQRDSRSALDHQQRITTPDAN